MSLENIVRRRAGKRQSVTKNLKELEDGLPDDPATIDYYIEKFNVLDQELVDLDKAIDDMILESGSYSDSEYLKQAQTCEEYLDNVRLIVIRLKHKHFEVGTGENPSSDPPPKLRLPNLELPSFDGKPEEFTCFITAFETLLNKFNLTQFEKYSYLLQQVSGPAREILTSVPQGERCYSTAKTLLSDAFSSVTLQQFAVIDKLSKLSIRSESDFFRWISSCRVLSQQVHSLDIDNEIFLQFFIWNSLPEKFKSIFMNVTNSPTPSLTDILENAFVVHNRVKESNRSDNTYKFPEYRESVTMATTAQPQTQSTYVRPCQLCNADGSSEAVNHKIQDCPKYKTPQSKLNKIRSLNGCSKCALLNHTVTSCKYRFFSKCSNCGVFHKYFLCVKGNKDTPVDFPAGKNKNQAQNLKSKQDKISSDSNPVSVNVMSNGDGGDNVIPTLTLKLPKKKGTLDVRAMYDPASQVSFITEKFAQRVRHKIVKESVNVTITGFNEVRNLNTKIIELSIPLNGEIRNFQAIVVKNIKSKIKSPLFKDIVRKFAEANIALADKHLNSNCADIDILLGVDFAHILPVQSVSFGAEHKSLLYNTCNGVMLAGNLVHLMENLQSLHLVKETFEKLKSL